MTEQIMSELDQLAYEAYIADCQVQSIFVVTEWRDLNPLTQKRYRAIAHQLRNHYTNGFISAVQLESSLLASLKVIGVEIKHHEGDDVTASYYRWRVNALDRDGYAESFNQALTGLIGELMQEYQGDAPYPEQQKALVSRTKREKNLMARQNEHLRAMSDQEVTDRYTKETLKLKVLNQFGRQSERFLGYPNTYMMNRCRRELEHRGLPIPHVQPSQEEARKAGGLDDVDPSLDADKLT